MEIPLQTLLDLTRRNDAYEAYLVEELFCDLRLDRHETGSRHQVINVHDLIREATGLCLDELRYNNIFVKQDFLAHDPDVQGDTQQLIQVFGNLLRALGNRALVGGLVKIRTYNVEREDGPHPCPNLVVEFVDGSSTGDASNLESGCCKVCEGSDPGNSHLGLEGDRGVAICHSILAAHAGYLETLGAGMNPTTTYAVHLSTALPTAGLPARPGPPTEVGGMGFPPRSILLVEDNREARLFLQRILTAKGHAVVAVDSLVAAYNALERESFELLLSDIQLPDGSGLELMREMGGRAIKSGVAMSGFGSDEDIRLSKDAGFAEHLTKPIDFRTLETVIEAVTSRSAGQ